MGWGDGGVVIVGVGRWGRGGWREDGGGAHSNLPKEGKVDGLDGK